LKDGLSLGKLATIGYMPW